MKRTIQIVLAILVVGGLALVAYNGSTTGPVLPSDAKAVQPDDWSKGAPTAPLTIIEYADFQCPACKVYSTWVDSIANDYAGKVRVVYRYFPLPSHRNSRTSAAAVEAAGRQGKFWQMHDVMFDNQETWSELSDPKPSFEGYAAQLGLDIAKFKADSASSEVATRVERDYQLGERMKVDSTPSLFLNGIKAESPRDYESLKKLVNAMLQAG